MALNLEQFYAAPWVKVTHEEGDVIELRGGLPDKYRAAEAVLLGIRAPVTRNYDAQNRRWVFAIATDQLPVDQLAKFNITSQERAGEKSI